MMESRPMLLEIFHNKQLESKRFRTRI